MTKSKFYLITLLTAILLSVVLGSSSVFASDTSSTSQAELEPTISVPVSQWNELKSNNEKALNLIEASSVPLTEAQTIAVKQRQELNEAHNTIDKLTTELDKAKADLVKQEVTLSEMSSSLIELKGQIENDKKTIKRLRMQRNLSQILGAGATIGVVIYR
jgi:septal ring factor EnvC (AmiA/AmiB activator)